MYTQNFIAMEKEKELQGCSEIIPGLIKKTGAGQTSLINKAPEYILFEAQKKLPLGGNFDIIKLRIKNIFIKIFNLNYI